MIARRQFIFQSLTASAGLGLLGLSSCKRPLGPAPTVKGQPVVISTWRHGVEANEAAWQILGQGGHALDAVEAGVRVPEADPEVMSVGFGGLPDRDGRVSLDACIMDEKGRAGSVCFLENIKHPISVARLVMEKTPHVMLAGQGALEFALDNGFEQENLLTAEAKAQWEEWLKEAKYKPVINIENHDTISMIAIDAEGRISGACTTSGAAYKLHGRVGDSPIIGAGLFCDDEVGGAAATGQGELVMRTLGSFLIVELMRNGLSPQAACEEAVRRIVKKIPDYKDYQIGYIAIDKSGQTGAYCLHPGFDYAITRQGNTQLILANSYLQGS